VASKCVRKIITTAKSKADQKDEISKPKEERRQRRQILYLHPGPPKTATTTIQQLMTDHQGRLNEDNIFLVGKLMPTERWSCKFPLPITCLAKTQNINSTCAIIVRDELDEYYQAGADVILTDEQIGIQFARSMKPKDYDRQESGARKFFEEIVKRNDWEVRLLIGYRPYFDFVRSYHGQKHKSRGVKLKFLSWPGHGWGIHVPPMNERLFPDDWPTSEVLVNRFRPFVDRLDVFDITPNTKQGDFTVHFFCNLLENANSACSAQKTLVASPQKEVRANEAVELEYDRIATAAADLGLVNKTEVQRPTVAAKIQEYMMARKIEVGDLPLVCPTTANTKILYNQSLALEMALFPERNPKWMVEELFDEMMKKNKLCSVDVNKVLETEEWKKFFQSCQQNIDSIACERNSTEL